MIVVLGAGGQLGTAFRSVYPDAHFVDRAGLDLTDTGAIADRLASFSPTALVNCAAYTAVDRAEAEQDMAHLVNAEAVAALARFAADTGIPLVTYSTDYVFPGDGTTPYVESDPTDPVNAYGRSKLAGEVAALDLYPGTLVIRTSWVLSGTHPNFVATMLRLARRGEPWRVVDDQVGCPTVAGDLAAATAEAVDAGVTGILHLTNDGVYHVVRAGPGGARPGRARPGPGGAVRHHRLPDPGASTRLFGAGQRAGRAGGPGARSLDGRTRCGDVVAALERSFGRLTVSRVRPGNSRRRWRAALPGIAPTSPARGVRPPGRMRSPRLGWSRTSRADAPPPPRRGRRLLIGDGHGQPSRRPTGQGTAATPGVPVHRFGGR